MGQGSGMYPVRAGLGVKQGGQDSDGSWQGVGREGGNEEQSYSH